MARQSDGTAPLKIDGADVVTYAIVDNGVNATGKTRHLVGGNLIGPARKLAICQYQGDAGYYLCYCDDDWTVQADTWHRDLHDAKAQAEFEFAGICSRWQNET